MTLFRHTPTPPTTNIRRKFTNASTLSQVSSFHYTFQNDFVQEKEPPNDTATPLVASYIPFNADTASAGTIESQNINRFRPKLLYCEFIHLEHNIRDHVDEDIFRTVEPMLLF